MTTTTPRVPTTPAITVTGRQGTVARLRPTAVFSEIPAHPSRFDIVDAWRMPGGMHMACIRGSSKEYAFLLFYVDEQVRSLALRLGIDPSLAIDVWHWQSLLGVRANDPLARDVMRNVARAAADGAVEFAPIRPEARAVWRTAVDSLTAVTIATTARETVSDGR